MHKNTRTMSRVLIVILCLFSGIPYTFCETDKAASEFSLSLKDTIIMAFKNNKDIRIQEQEIKVAKANMLAAYSQFLPKVNLDAGYTHSGAILQLALPESKKDLGIFGGYKNDNRLGVSIDESIYNGGANFANFKQAELGLEVQEETLHARKLELEFEAKRLYYGLLLAYETERIAQQLVSQAQSHYEDVKNKFSQGTASKFDLLQSKVQVSKLMPELVRAKNAIDSIMADLKKLLSLKMQDYITVKEKLAYSPIEINEGEFLKNAYMNRPEMILKSLGINISKWQIEMAKAGSQPQVSTGLDYSYRSNNLGNMFNNRHSNWSAGLSVTIPVFDGFSTKAKVEEAKARYAQAGLDKENLSDQIAVDIKKACLDLNQALSIIDASKDNIEEAKEALKIAEVSFDNGEGTNIDILDTQVTLSQIEKNYSEGIYDYLMAKAFLERSVGQGFKGEEKNEKKD